MSAEDDKAVIRAYLDAVGALDVDAVPGLFHEEGRLVLPYAPEGIPPTVDGRDAVADYYASLPQMISALNFANYNIRATEEPGQYIAQYTSDATIRPTGASYRNTYITTVSVTDGLISELAEYFDPIPLITAMGGTVTPPAAPD